MVNELEKAFDKGFQKYLSLVYISYNQPDIPFYLIQKSKMRFMPRQKPDRILLSNTHPNLIIEMKSSYTSSISLQNIKAHQIADLIESDKKGGKAFFLFAFNKLKSCYLIPINTYLTIVNKTKQKSISESAMIDPAIIPIKIEMLKVNTRLDLNFLIL